ncbi:MAG: LacI family DNA-binding transcriptional regulator [Victivallaceae bacterium]|nr:LacI family DNA-binding transcriptional regulator [Victivallaceae bacterium]
MVTIGEIAAAAGVSRYTASKVLNGEPSVRENTKERVLAVASELGYVPNLNARALVSGRSNLVGLVVPYVTDGFYSQMIEVLEHLAAEAGWMLVYKSTYNDAGAEARVMRSFLSLKVCAMLIVPVVEHPDHAVHLLAHRNVPLVYLDRPGLPGCLTIVNDNFQSAKVMTGHLLRRSGKVGFLGSFYGSANPTAADRRRGYVAAMEESGKECCFLPVDASRVRQDNELFAYENASAFFRSGGRCDALFCVTDAAAFGAAKAAREAGFLPGKNFFIGGHDDLPFGNYANPSITTMAQPIREICSCAVGTLKSLLAGKSLDGAEVQIFRSRLVVRDSA